MTTEALREQNERFQKGAVQLSELIPSGGLMEATSMIIRSSRRIQSHFEKLLHCETESQFSKAVDGLENHMDEVIFILDQLDIANKERKIRLINDFLKDGYDLLSVYSLCIDQLIKDRLYSEE